MGGGSLKWGPPLVKRDFDYRFLPLFLSGFVRQKVLDVFGKKIKNGKINGKWVCASAKIKKFAKKRFDKNGKFAVFETVLTTPFSLELQRKVYPFVNLPVYYIKL